MKVSVLAFLLLAACSDSGGGGTPDGGSGAGPSGYPLKSIGGGVAYTTSLTIGGSQKFDVIIDTGSTTLGVAGSGCSNCAVSPEYSPGSTATDQHSTAMSQYADMSGWTGENYQDSVAVTGDANTIDMRFTAMTTQSGFFQDAEYEGILGFAGMQIALSGTDAYVSKRSLEQFAFRMCSDAGGTMWLGPPDAASQVGSAQFAALNTSVGYYLVTLAGASAGSASLDGASGLSIADTGTTIMLLPQTTADELTAAVTGGSGYAGIFGTQTIEDADGNSYLDPGTHTAAEIDAALPTFSVSFEAPSGDPITLTATATESYLMPIEGGMYLYGVVGGADLNQGIPPILGDAFLHGYTTTWDLQNMQLGFANAAGCAAPDAAQVDAHVIQHARPRMPGRRLPH